MTAILFRVERLTGKQIEIAREVMPSAVKIGVLRPQQGPGPVARGRARVLLMQVLGDVPLPGIATKRVLTSALQRKGIYVRRAR
jgi:hypothetical protein